MKAYILREKFLDFFKSKRHKIVDSDTLVPRDDPTVLFTPAGMNQFKKEFLGFNSGYSRAATAQRCLRTDDLDKVGKTRGHHTFFEMLGNFSFGDYFKKEAISYAWEFLTEVLSIDESRLWVSVYKQDQEAYNIWKDLIKIPEAKIIKLGDKENFWPSEAVAKGPNGPCGPCSEIFFDQGLNPNCKNKDCGPACDCGRFIEVWNLVFTQSNRKPDGALEPLPNKNIDTGMGIERLAAVMQGAPNNFETDIFEPIIKEIRSGLRAQGSAGQKQLVYAVADHIRAITFAIYDGVLPSNEARGYVVRKIIRKSLLHLRALGTTKPYLYKLVPVLADTLPYYPQLQERKENIAQIILAEERGFISITENSDSLFAEKFKGLLNNLGPELAGRLAFQLYDTHGVPLELTQDWLAKHNISISIEAFNKELSEQKARSKLHSLMKGDVFSPADLFYNMKETKFLGYKDLAAKAKILKIIKNEQETKKIDTGDEAVIVLDETVFYPEGGGQVGDSGELVRGENTFEVYDTKKSGKVIQHIGKVKAGSFRIQNSVQAEVNLERRLSIARNHTATHLLQAALRKVLGLHVKQQGSFVADERLRFDFTHFKAVSKEELDRVEEAVNGFIINNFEIKARQMSLAEAKKTGALAFFGEKYEGRVRVISIEALSKEFCGGTHLDWTGQIGIFKITEERSVASGVRRIEAVTGKNAYKIIKEQEDILRDISSLLNAPVKEIPQELEKRNSRLKEIEKGLNLKKAGNIEGSIDKLTQGSEEINGISLIAGILEDADIDLLRQNLDAIKEKSKNSIILLASRDQNRAYLAMGLTPDLAGKGLDASKLIRDVSKVIGGSGGGRADFAQAGGNNPDRLEDAIGEFKKIIRERYCQK